MPPKHEIQVLVVDDDPDFLGLLSSELKQIPGVRVHVAHGPKEAVRMLSRKNYELVVNDWALKNQTAPDVLNCADTLLDSKLHEKKVPVMFISGSEKVSQTQRLRNWKHFEPVSFLLKRCGPPLISLLAERLLDRFYPMRALQRC